MARKVFVSYAHRLDQEAADDFRAFYADERDVFIDKSIRKDIGDLQAQTIKNKLSQLIRDSTVTVVLIGQETGGRSWVDWEIYHSLRAGTGVTRNGLIGIKIPNKRHWIPERLERNVPQMGLVIEWPRDYRTLSNAIEEAFGKRYASPDLSAPVRNRNSIRRAW